MTLRRAIPLLGCLLLAAAQADERRHSDADTSRHGPPPAKPTGPARLLPQGARPPAQGRTLLEDVDPAVRQYWSDKCVQQRARGWGNTGDCNHPAYSGGYYGTAPLVVPYGPPNPAYPDRGHPSAPYARSGPSVGAPRVRADTAPR